MIKQRYHHHDLSPLLPKYKNVHLFESLRPPTRNLTWDPCYRYSVLLPRLFISYVVCPPIVDLLAHSRDAQYPDSANLLSLPRKSKLKTMTNNMNKSPGLRLDPPNTPHHQANIRAKKRKHNSALRTEPPSTPPPSDSDAGAQISPSKHIKRETSKSPSNHQKLKPPAVE